MKVTQNFTPGGSPIGPVEIRLSRQDERAIFKNGTQLNIALSNGESVLIGMDGREAMAEVAEEVDKPRRSYRKRKVRRGGVSSSRTAQRRGKKNRARPDRSSEVIAYILQHGPTRLPDIANQLGVSKSSVNSVFLRGGFIVNKSTREWRVSRKLSTRSKQVANKLSTGVDNHRKTGKSLYTCKRCGAIFTNRYALGGHTAHAHGKLARQEGESKPTTDVGFEATQESTVGKQEGSIL